MPYFFKSGLVLFLLLSWVVSTFGEDVDNIAVIRIATPKWEGQTNKDGTGLFFDIIRRVYEPVGIKLKYQLVPWKRAQKMVKSDEADAMLCMWKEAAIEKKQLLPESPMFVEYTSVVFKKKNIKEWKGIKTLNGKRAIWLRGYNYHTAPELKDANLKWDEVDQHEQIWRMLNKDRVDVYIDARIDIDQYVKDHHIDMAPYGLEILWKENSYMAFRDSERSKKLIEIYDKGIIELSESGELRKIYETWGVRYPEDAWEK